ncbi:MULTISPECIES: dephospho-CoA kinase [Moorena]|uniref:Dephospho-CoA kinase n=1 Tax=Moorena producens 3L TaxID=489825 RepID=F4XU53_9CYAN|nr:MULTISPECIES: dephospho-CoA kinase [Moorena]NEQ14760.1 dephospho-CoA kinase [Moorena sp. SIO3E2]EGJ32029.1 dephospho-CoA kinase [Moorena producens 3L]NEP30237.1 dephospho-CoA kinase [Moorena sp. SIO3B2]NEP64254.1 dephospho-CoA kinase [Moorena sp. SIO3A5]NEQ04950.1 dephospho-CoA kinase [Moorena sp. SIO4E2]
MNQKRIIGLTGGIATGKTTVSNYLADTYRLPILDADIYAREAVQPDSPILKQIYQRYGLQVQHSDSTLNRKRLGEIIFSNPTERQWLEQQIHPYVRDRFRSELDTFLDAIASGGNPQDRAASLVAPTVILVIPLLFEAKMTDLVTEIWVVSCSPEQQLRRIQKRDRISKEQAQARINSQLPLQQKIELADLVLDNSSTQEALIQQVSTALATNSYHP